MFYYIPPIFLHGVIVMFGGLGFTSRAEEILQVRNSGKYPAEHGPEKRLVLQRNVPFLRRNSEQSAEIFLGTWLMTVPLRITATAYGSLLFTTFLLT